MDAIINLFLQNAIEATDWRSLAILMAAPVILLASGAGLTGLVIYGLTPRGEGPYPEMSVPE
jgi:hypothetical protein